MKAIVTGGFGFIGSHLVNELMGRDCEVVVIDDLSHGEVHNITSKNLHSEKFSFNIDDISDWMGKIPDVDVIYHLAAKHVVPQSFKTPDEYWDTNVKGTYNLFKTYPKTRIVNISSSAAVECISPYGVSKRAAEIISMMPQFENIISLRLFNVFGERQPDCGAVVPAMLKPMLKGEPPVIHGDGSQKRDFTYVGDVVSELIKYGSGAYREMTEPRDIGYGKPRSIKDLFKAMAEQIQFNKKPNLVKRRKGDIDFSCSTKPIITPRFGFDDGLKRTVKWYKENDV